MTMEITIELADREAEEDRTRNGSTFSDTASRRLFSTSTKTVANSSTAVGGASTELHTITITTTDHPNPSTAPPPSSQASKTSTAPNAEPPGKTRTSRRQNQDRTATTGENSSWQKVQTRNPKGGRTKKGGSQVHEWVSNSTTAADEAGSDPPTVSDVSMETFLLLEK